jgi:hypothetical protein
VRILITGNADWLVPAAVEARRWGVFDVGTARLQDTKYFAEIDAEMANGGAQALMRELLNFDLSKVNLRQTPKTEALLDQKFASLAPEPKWWFEMLSSGSLPGGAGDYSSLAQDEHGGACPTTALYDRYIDSVRKTNVSRRSAESTFGRFLHKHVPGLTKHDKKCSYFSTERAKWESGRGVYVFPSLKTCREAFESEIGHTIKWSIAEGENWTIEPEPEKHCDKCLATLDSVTGKCRHCNP